MWGHREQAAIWKPQAEALGETNAGPLSWNDSLQNWGEIDLWFKPLSLWYFVIAAEANSETNPKDTCLGERMWTWQFLSLRDKVIFQEGI